MSNIWAHLRRYWRGVALLPAQQQRLEAWLAQPAEDLRRPFAEARYVVVDVESTGLDLQKDRLIAIGAVAVVGGRIDLAQSFEVVLRQDQASSRANILIHGIGGAAQREGQPPVDALLDFLEFLGPSPLVAFHVAFDSTMIGRAMRAYLGINLKPPGWIWPMPCRDFYRSGGINIARLMTGRAISGLAISPGIQPWQMPWPRPNCYWWPCRWPRTNAPSITVRSRTLNSLIAGSLGRVEAQFF